MLVKIDLGAVVVDPMKLAKRPVTMLAGPYGHPLHPALVTVPIGAWVASIVFDVASHVSGDGLRTALGVGES